MAVNSGFRRLAGQIITASPRPVGSRGSKAMIDTLQSVILADRPAGVRTMKAPPHDGGARYRIARTRPYRIDQAPRSPRVTKRGSRLPEADPRKMPGKPPRATAENTSQLPSGDQMLPERVY